MNRSRLLVFVVMIASTLSVLYVGVNLLLLLFVPILHDLTLRLKIQDRECAAPLKGVEVSWVKTNPSTGFQWDEPIGTTDAKGQLNIAMTIQEQPLWAWPRLGKFKLSGRSIKLRGEGYHERVCDLRSLVPDTSYSESEAIAVILLDRKGKRNADESPKWSK